MAVRVSRREYYDSFRMHLKVYRKAVQDGVKVSTHSMILYYAVECGLKALILFKYNKNYSTEFEKGTDNDKIEFFERHKLNEMIEAMEFGPRFKVPVPDDVKCRNDGTPVLDVKDFHSVWRYRNGKYDSSQDGSKKTLDAAEQMLVKISELIEVKLSE